MFEFSGIALIVGIVAVVMVILIITFMARYKTVGPDKAMIVTGSYLTGRNTVGDPGKKIKIVKGGGAFILPIFQQYKTVSLESITMSVHGNKVTTQNGVPITTEGTAVIKIGAAIEEIGTAAEQFPGGTENVRAQCQVVLEGHLRGILALMTIEEIFQDRSKLGQNVQEHAGKDLAKMGIIITSFTIKELKDDEGYLEAIAKPRIAAVKRDALIAESIAMKESSVARASAEEIAKKADILKETNIAEAEKEKELKVADFKRQQETARAQADLAYEAQKAISKQAVIEAEMKSQQIQKERDIELAEREAVRMEKQLEGTVKKQADADLYQRQQAALAEKFEQETKAQADAESLRLQAEADAGAKKARAEADAQAERAKGLAEADVEKAKGQAQADAEKAKQDILRAKGQAEAQAEKARIDNLKAAGEAEAAAIEAIGLAEARVAKEKADVEVNREKGLAEAMLLAGELKTIEMIMAALPEIAGKIAAPMGNVDKITIVDTGGNGDGMGKMTSTVTNLMHTLPTIVENMTGVNLGNVLKNLTKGRLSGEASETLDLQAIAKATQGMDPATLQILMDTFNKKEDK